MKILVFDNYDSFTYNLVHVVEKITGTPVEVFRNDQISLDEVERFDKIILSPGPGVPAEAGLLLPLIKRFAPTKSMLGVCLGHQAIGEVFGGTLVNLDKVFHGLSTPITVNTRRVKAANDVFGTMPATIQVGRYHSWVISEKGFPEALEITARDGEGQIMALRHKTYDVQCVQFHPESVLTPEGETIMRNWLEIPA